MPTATLPSMPTIVVPGRSLDKLLIDEILSIYHAEFRFVRSVLWDGRSLAVTIDAKPYPFTVSGHIRYVTATMAALYASQIAYLLGYLLIGDRCDTPDPPLTLDDFFAARDRGQLRIGDFQLRCRRPIAVGPFSATAACSTVKRTERRLFVAFQFQFDSGAFLGDSTVVVPRPASRG